MKEQSYNTNSLFLSSLAKNTLSSSNAEDRWAVILAGANDRPRRGLTPARLRGQRPIHFCRAPGGDIVINQTRELIARVFPPERTLFVVTREHISYYEDVLADVPLKNLIVQPQDDGTTFAVLYAALRFKEINPSAVLTFFPPDFRVADEGEFMTQVKSATAAARSLRKLILLGTKAESPDTEREWIEPDPATPVNENFDVWRIRRFLPQPNLEQAQELMTKGGLWNSSVMVGTAATFLRKIRRAAPDIYEKFREAKSKIGTPGEERAMEKAYYSNYAYTDFSQDVLAKSSDKLAVIPVPDSKRSAVAVKQAVSPFVAEKIFEPMQKYAVAGRSI